MTIRRRYLLILALATASVLASPGAASPSTVARTDIAPATAADRSIGRADAPVTVIEYASFACHHCADWHLFVYPAFKARFIDTGQVRLVFRNLPTAPAEISLPGAALARCAEPERFFDVASALMLGQHAVVRGGDREAWYAPAVAVSGRTRAQLDDCADTEATRDALERDIASAQAADVRNTPTFFVNGRRVADRSLGGLEVAIRAAAAGQ